MKINGRGHQGPGEEATQRVSGPKGKAYNLPGSHSWLKWCGQSRIWVSCARSSAFSRVPRNLDVDPSFEMKLTLHGPIWMIMGYNYRKRKKKSWCLSRSHDTSHCKSRVSAEHGIPIPHPRPHTGRNATPRNPWPDSEGMRGQWCPEPMRHCAQSSCTDCGKPWTLL